MYKFKIENKEKLLDGRTITYYSKKVGISREYLTSILNNKKNCSKTTAYCIVKAYNSEAEINDYFKQEK